MEIIKKFFMRFFKEENLYLHLLNKHNDEYNLEVLLEMIPSIYVNKTLELIYSYFVLKGMIKKRYYTSTDFVNSILSPSYEHKIPIKNKIIITNVKNKKKLISYLKRNGFIWRSGHLIKGEELCFKTRGILNITLDKNKITHSDTEYWLNEEYRNEKFNFYNEEEFYNYWEQVKKYMCNIFKQNLKNDNHNYYIQ